MEGFTQGLDVVQASFQGLWLDFFSAVPRIVAAVLVLVIGWAIAVALGKVVMRAVEGLKLDEGLAKAGFQDALLRAGVTLNVAAFIGGLVRWVLIVVFLLSAANILALAGVTTFLTAVLAYVPNLIAAAVMLVAAMLLSRFLAKLIHVSMEAGKLTGGEALGSLVKWAVLVFGFLAAVEELGVAEETVSTVVTGAVAMVALAGGIAFGIAGKETAADLLTRCRKYFGEK